jgi:hypothetical protein
MGEMRDAYDILVKKKLKGRSHSWHSWEVNVRMDVKEI